MSPVFYGRCCELFILIAMSVYATSDKIDAFIIMYLYSKRQSAMKIIHTTPLEMTLQMQFWANLGKKCLKKHFILSL